MYNNNSETLVGIDDVLASMGQSLMDFDGSGGRKGKKSKLGIICYC